MSETTAEKVTQGSEEPMDIALTYSYSDACPHCREKTEPIDLLEIDTKMADGTRLCGDLGMCPKCQKTELVIWMPPVPDGKLKWAVKQKGGDLNAGS